MVFALNTIAVDESGHEVQVEDWSIKPNAAAEIGFALVHASTEGHADRTLAGPE